MKVLMVYATNSSGTQQVADIIGDVLKQTGHTVTTKRANEPGADDFGSYDFVGLGSCTWERFAGKQRLDGQLQEHMYELVEKMKGQSFSKKLFAVFGLGDSTYAHFCMAAEHLENFVTGLGGTLIVPPLRIDGFFFNLDQNRQQAKEWANKLVSNI